MSRKNNSKTRRDERYWSAIERQQSYIQDHPGAQSAPIEDFHRREDKRTEQTT